MTIYLPLKGEDCPENCYRVYLKCPNCNVHTFCAFVDSQYTVAEALALTDINCPDCKKASLVK